MPAAGSEDAFGPLFSPGCWGPSVGRGKPVLEPLRFCCYIKHCIMFHSKILPLSAWDGALWMSQALLKVSRQLSDEEARITQLVTGGRRKYHEKTNPREDHYETQHTGISAPRGSCDSNVPICAWLLCGVSQSGSGCGRRCQLMGTTAGRGMGVEKRATEV